MKLKTAIDTIILIAMASGDKPSLEACRRLRNAGHSLLVPSTVLQECELLCRSGRSQDREYGGLIAKKLTETWGIVPAPAVEPFHHGVALENVRKIEKQFSLPADLEENDLLTLVDAAMIGCQRLLTWSAPLLRMPRAEVSLFLQSQDLSGPQMVSPHEAVAGLRR